VEAIRRSACNGWRLFQDIPHVGVLVLAINSCGMNQTHTCRRTFSLAQATSERRSENFSKSFIEYEHPHNS